LLFLFNDGKFYLILAQRSGTSQARDACTNDKRIGFDDGHNSDSLLENAG
jgi:hypothetical protein